MTGYRAPCGLHRTTAALVQVVFSQKRVFLCCLWNEQVLNCENDGWRSYPVLNSSGGFEHKNSLAPAKHFVDRWTLTKLRSYFLFFRLPKNVFTHKRVFLWWQSPWAVFQSGTPIVTNWQRCKWCYCRLLAHTQHCSDTLFEMDFSRPVTTKNVWELHPNTKTSFWGKSNVFEVSFASRLQ